MVVFDLVHDHARCLPRRLSRVSHKDALVGLLCGDYHRHCVVHSNRNYPGHDQHPDWSQCFHVSAKTAS